MWDNAAILVAISGIYSTIVFIYPLSHVSQLYYRWCFSISALLTLTLTLLIVLPTKVTAPAHTLAFLCYSTLRLSSSFPRRPSNYTLVCTLFYTALRSTTLFHSHKAFFILVFEYEAMQIIHSSPNLHIMAYTLFAFLSGQTILTAFLTAIILHELLFHISFPVMKRSVPSIRQTSRFGLHRIILPTPSHRDVLNILQHVVEQLHIQVFASSQPSFPFSFRKDAEFMDAMVRFSVEYCFVWHRINTSILKELRMFFHEYALYHSEEFHGALQALVCLAKQEECLADNLAKDHVSEGIGSWKWSRKYTLLENEHMQALLNIMQRMVCSAQLRWTSTDRKKLIISELVYGFLDYIRKSSQKEKLNCANKNKSTKSQNWENNPNLNVQSPHKVR